MRRVLQINMKKEAFFSIKGEFDVELGSPVVDLMVGVFHDVEAQQRLLIAGVSPILLGACRPLFWSVKLFYESISGHLESPSGRC